LVQRVQHLAFQTLEVFQRDVEEIPRAAGGVEHAHVAEPAMELAQFGDGLVALAVAV
jgi:hypothetical protein